jgi:hypothetical protein
VAGGEHDAGIVLVALREKAKSAQKRDASAPALAQGQALWHAQASSAPGVMQLMKQAGVVAMPMRTGVQPALRELR